MESDRDEKEPEGEEGCGLNRCIKGGPQLCARAWPCRVRTKTKTALLMGVHWDGRGGQSRLGAFRTEHQLPHSSRDAGCWRAKVSNEKEMNKDLRSTNSI